MRAGEMTAAHPHVQGQVNNGLIRCVECCFDCVQACASCADACLGEPEVADLAACIRLDLDCADVCLALGLIATRHTAGDPALIRAQLQACEIACGRCAAECERHGARHRHCAICAEACRDCERACRAALDTLGPCR
jgi:hypothetical protein